ncbi:laminin subunit alpha-3 isoform X2 [Latimeria chalumnae]|uniref:laminin subunit alpha-3 isoform X2 n=1 Tax=Latimeria chalumnae TaxID=7897 RepID=UPI00313CB281
MSNMARSKRGAAALLLLFTSLLSSSCHLGSAQSPADKVLGFSLHPPYFNLAERAKISATATCGEDELGRPKQELYCKLVGGPAAGVLSQTIQGQFCDYCNSSDPNKAHPVTNAVDGTERWWQSPPLSRGLTYNGVNVTLDLGQLLHVAYVLIKFANSPRPDLWVLERSVDYGRTYLPWQYFAHSQRDCIETFRKDASERITRDDDIVCTTEYSRIVPLENGEIVVSLVNGRPGAKNFIHSPVLQEFTKATNIRLRFLRTSTLLGHLISKAQRDPTVTRRYYYSIKDISVGGRCVCHGHAAVCNLRSPTNPLQCECQHNTCGESCDRCCPGYNQKPWRPAVADSANECEPCNCHGHASDCYYDAEVDRRQASLNIYRQHEGGGVCINCQHNTAGINCERCAVGYYRPYGVPKEAPDGCIPCRCNSDFTDGCEEGSGRCYCKPNFSGDNCDTCADGYYNFPSCIRIPVYPPPTKDPSAGDIKVPGGCSAGYFGPNCQPCQCYNPGVLTRECDSETGECKCRTGFQGFYCESCAVGYFNYPYCQECRCNTAGTRPEACDTAGRCLCRSQVDGPQCDQCQSGYHSFPSCQDCSCDRYGSVDNVCGPRGQCRCRPNYAGLTCNQCAPGHYAYPTCLSCQCSLDGSDQSVCNPVTGQCSCQHGITGQRCDRCLSGAYDFPYCQGISSECDPAGTETNALAAHPGLCRCLLNVEGRYCNKCKPLYWNLAVENLQGCIECQCDVKGTISGIGECQQKDGKCYCKPNICTDSCETCKAGYFALETRNYFGCQGCRCDVGGSVGLMCSERSGTCQCRENIVGHTCKLPKNNYYFPDLHQMKFEIEDGTTPNGRAVRFGYDPQEFANFSWRGYAQMSPVQNEVRVTLHVEKSNLYLFRVILRYLNPGTETVSGHVTAYQSRPNTGPVQTKRIVFPPSKDPAFVTIPGSGFADPFPLTPGKWIVSIKAEGVLLDYLVLLPSDYYEAPILQVPVTEPCTYATYSGHTDENCLVYQHVPLDRFPFARGVDGFFITRGRRRREISARQPTPEHPEMADISGRQVELQLVLRVPQPGRYVVVLEYANEDEKLHSVNVIVSNSPGPVTRGRANLYSCKYSFLCRSVAIDDSNRIAVYELPVKVELLLQGTSLSFLLHKAYAIPVEEFSIEHIEPKVKCIATHGSFIVNSALCIPSMFETPPTALVLEPHRDGRLSSELRQYDPQASPLPSARENGVLLKSPQNEITFNTRVSNMGRYVVVIHFRQPEHPSFPVDVLVDGGRPWAGSFNASFCPHVFGCRDQVIAENRIELDVTDRDLSVTLKAPSTKTLTLDQILIVPADSYNPDLLNEKPLDKSSDFINNCGENSFYIDLVTSSKFCKDSARSLVAFYNNGALPCNCHDAGATSSTCNPMGGQCSCRPNVIGRNCTRCATGYYGFPYCRPCSCGRRLCDEISGQCICPPQTVMPKCEVCQKETFSYHPLLGCEGCNCSRTGIIDAAELECDRDTGQCKCSPRIAGRQCDHCAPGFYTFPDCYPCDCNKDGAQPDVCDPQTGKCLCKENVEGTKCNTCVRGSFYLDPDNPKGCTACFCFGITDQCHSTEKRRTKFVDMKNWKLETADKRPIPVVHNPASNTVVADVQELPATIHDLYWVAPSSYLGDRVSSYGGSLTYQVKSFGLPSEGMVLLDKRPDVQLTGLQMTIVNVDPNSPLPDRFYQRQVQLVEGNFRHATTNSPVSRKEMMMVLSGLEGLYIRALYFTETQRLSLGDVGLEETNASGSGSIASNVEVCSCPPAYGGDSCQQCTPGYYRENKGYYAGRCVPCQCNGHSNQCQDGSGICVNCQHSTTGSYCDRCKEGYFGNATYGSCDICLCPLSVPSNSFATGCRKVGATLQCLCKPGYTGQKCERCAPGYFGNPMKIGSVCRPCNCGNDGNPSSCDPLTGVCTNQEPKDISTDENCDHCDSCVSTLLDDLNRMDLKLQRIKSQLQNANSSSYALERMKKIEKLTRDTKDLLDIYRTNVESHRVKVNELESESMDLTQDLDALNDKAEVKSRKAQALLSDTDQVSLQAEGLLFKVQTVLKKIQDLLAQLQDTNADGGTLPSGDFAKKLAEAERMMREMRDRNFDNQRSVAQNEKTEAEDLLDHVRNELQKHLKENQKLSETISDQLTDYMAKLNDLKDVLNDAVDLTRQAEKNNRGNEMTMEDIKKRANDLKKQQVNVSDLLKMAENNLQQTNDLMKMLDQSKEEYEKLAAELDGAKLELMKKVKTVSESASKEPLVVKAEEHAKLLDDLAKQLEEAKKNTSTDDLVRCAVDAANSYENIVKAVKAAEEAANKSLAAANNALATVKAEDLPGKARKLKDEGDNLLDEAKKVKNKLKDVDTTLQRVQRDLRDAKDKKTALEKTLKAAQDRLNMINRGDIDNTINSAKEIAANANTTADNIMSRLSPILTDVENINNTYKGTQAKELDTILNATDATVKDLVNRMPDLLKRLNSISDQMEPISNISENVNRIRELIQQARDAANKVAVPMRFNGSSGVEVHPPLDLDDLKAYTSLSLYLHRPLPRGDRQRRQVQDEGMFVMYFGNKNTSKDYIGITIKDDKLLGIYNFGGETVKLDINKAVSGSKTEDAAMNFVRFERIYQYAKLSYAEPGSNEVYEQTKKKSYEQNTLFNLDLSEVVFYVGGYPSDFTPPKELGSKFYVGCIELDMLNQNVFSLYNFKRTFNMNTTEVEPCKRKSTASDKFYFEGSGYAMAYTKETTKRGAFEQRIETTADNALLLFIEQGDSYLRIELENGYPIIRYKDESAIAKEEKGGIERINDGKEHTVSVILSPKDKKVVVLTNRKPFSVTYNFPQAFSVLYYYFGGVPSSIRKKYGIETPSFQGCASNIKNPNGISIFVETVGVSKRCSEDLKVIRSVGITRGGHLHLDSKNFTFPENFQVGFGFKTHHDGNLLNYKAQLNELGVYLEKGLLKLKTLSLQAPLQSSKNYTDGMMHYVSVMRSGNSLTLLVDDTAVGTSESVFKNQVSSAGQSNPIVIGSENFEGCISNVYIERSSEYPNVQDLAKNEGKQNASLGVCKNETLNNEPYLIKVKQARNRVSYKTEKLEKVHADKEKEIRLNNQENAKPEMQGCALSSHPEAIGSSYQFGESSASRLEYDFTPKSLKDKLSFSLDVRTVSTEGLIFYVANEAQTSHVALYLSSGRLVFTLGAGKRKIRVKSKGKYNDGKWHTVAFSRDGKKLHLIIDGLRSHSKSLTRDISLDIRSPFLLGAVPSLNMQFKFQDMPKSSFLGCIKNFKADGLMHTPSKTFGVTPCFDGHFETGAYFSAEGGHVVLDDAFIVGSNFELLFDIRPRVQNGILFHISNQNGDYLSLYMYKGKVTVHVNNGAGEFSTSVTPQHYICDGNWHKIAVFKRGNTVQLDVDTQNNHTIGPFGSQSTDTKDSLYVGGIPDTAVTPWLPTRTSYVGCLRNVKINEKLVSFTKVAAVHGAVSLSRCPAS